MDAKEQLINLYNRVDAKGRILLCALVIILHEGTEEEKALLSKYAKGKVNDEAIDKIYDKYYPIVQKRLVQGELI